MLSRRMKAAQIAEEHGFSTSGELADSGDINDSLNNFPNSRYVYSVGQA